MWNIKHSDFSTCTARTLVKCQNYLSICFIVLTSIIFGWVVRECGETDYVQNHFRVYTHGTCVWGTCRGIVLLSLVLSRNQPIGAAQWCRALVGYAMQKVRENNVGACQGQQRLTTQSRRQTGTEDAKLKYWGKPHSLVYSLPKQKIYRLITTQSWWWYCLETDSTVYTKWYRLLSPYSNSENENKMQVIPWGPNVLD